MTVNISGPVPTNLADFPEYLQAMRNANTEFRGDYNNTMEHVGFMMQKHLIIQERLVMAFIAVVSSVPGAAVAIRNSTNGLVEYDRS